MKLTPVFDAAAGLPGREKDRIDGSQAPALQIPLPQADAKAFALAAAIKRGKEIHDKALANGPAPSVPERPKDKGPSPDR